MNGPTIIRDLKELLPAEWDALTDGNPTVRHAYLLALQDSGCAGAGTGWEPMHLALRRDGRLVAAMPLYLKAHSRGEYVFDMIWARAFQQHGLSYYPKLLCAIPYTPVPGPRVLAPDPADGAVLIKAARDMAEDLGLSSIHVLFPRAAECDALREAGFMLRHDVQFHWQNRGYVSVDDYLADFSQPKRKKIRQDSRRVERAGLRFRHLMGADIDEGVLRFFFQCYCRTYIEHGNPPYLNFDFFQRLRTAMPEHLLIIVALRGDQPVAAALNFRDADCLYGRYWGAMEFVSGLHFETCYTQAIAHCIEHGLQRFEGGAQGEHKLSRGLLPHRTSSAHWIRDARFAAAIEDFLQRETPAVDDYLLALNEHSPYRKA